MKKEYRAIAFVLAGIILFTVGFGLGGLNNIAVDVEGGSVQVAATTTPTTQPTTQQTTVTTTQPSTEPTTVQTADTTTTVVADTTTTTVADTGISVPATPAEACAAYCKAVNDAKAYTGNASVRRIEQIDVGVDSCSVAILTSVLDSVVRNFIKSSDETFEITNGTYTNSDGETRNMNDRLYPGGRNVTVAEANVTSATATANADGGYTVTLKFPAETSDYANGTTSSEPTNHMTAMDPLNLATLSLDPIEIISANMNYSGATADATVDAEGKLVKLHINLPLNGTGEGGKGSLTAEIGVSGFMDTTFEITYK